MYIAATYNTDNYIIQLYSHHYQVQVGVLQPVYQTQLSYSSLALLGKYWKIVFKFYKYYFNRRLVNLLHSRVIRTLLNR